MTNAVCTRIYRDPQLNVREIMRCAGYRGETLPEPAKACLTALPDDLLGRVVFAIYPIGAAEEGLDLGFAKTASADLRKNLAGCERAVLFCATAGIAFDRLIKKYERISPARALWYQSIGAAYVEAVCDACCSALQKEYGGVRPRFSPGYGDLPLDMQKAIFAALSPEKHIGVTLNDNLFMTPTKSVTAIVGLINDE